MGTEKADVVWRCCICECPTSGYGHNARPVNGGRCCDECNAIYVIPARLEALLRDIPKPPSPQDGQGGCS